MDYKYIRAWGQMLGSFDYYINAQVEQARQDNAPQTATYRREDGTWATFEEVLRDDTKGRIAKIVSSL